MGIKHWSIILISDHYLVLMYRIYGSSPCMPSSVSMACYITNFGTFHLLNTYKKSVHITFANEVILILNHTGVRVLVAGTHKHCTRII